MAYAPTGAKGIYIFTRVAECKSWNVAKVAACDRGGWVDNGTVLCAYWPNDDDGDDDDSAVNNEEVVTEKPQTTGQVEV